MESILKEFLQFCEQRRSQDGQLPAALPDMAGHADENTGTRVDSEMASSASPAVTEHQDDSSSPPLENRAAPTQPASIWAQNPLWPRKPFV